MEDLSEASDTSPPRNDDIPSAGNDPRDPARPEVDEDDEDPPIGAPQQDMDATEDKEELQDLSDNDDDPNNNAAADNADLDAADASDAESELSEIDEAQFEDFDPINIAIEERPVAIDESNVGLLKAAKRKRGEGEEGVKKKRKEGKREKPKRSRRTVDDDDNFSGGEEIEGKRRRKTKAVEGEGKKEKHRPRKAATPENEEDLTPEERRKRALDRAMDEALKKPGQRRKRAGDITIEAQNDELIENMRIRMTDAAKADTESRSNDQPAMAKLKLLPEVISLLNRNKLKDQLVDPDTNLLEAVRFFLEPLNDGSLPAYNIQRSLFEVLGKLPITKDALVASGIGKVTWFYTKSTKPEPHVKRLADQLMRDWMRPILKRTDDYRKRELQEADYDPHVAAAKTAPTQVLSKAGISLAARERKLAAPGRENRAKAEGGHTSYTVVPKNNFQGGGAVPSARAQGDEAFRRFKAKHQQRMGGSKR